MAQPIGTPVPSHPEIKPAEAAGNWIVQGYEKARPESRLGLFPLLQ